jgi:DNA-binding NarL/FixJ family response regulator
MGRLGARRSQGVRGAPILRCMRKVPVYVVEDSAAVREMLVGFLEEIDGVEVVGTADNPRAAVDGILAARPACVVLDYQLHGGTGVDVMAAVRPRHPGAVFIVLTNHANPQYRRACMDAGARWFLDKNREFAMLRTIIDELRATPRT